MEVQKKQLILIGLLIALVIILILLFNVTQTTNQAFSFSEFELNKTISISEAGRIETYEFNSENPIIAFLIVPKTIANDVSQLKISGDYSTEIIESDPILLIRQNEYTPGIKKLIIETTLGNKNHTTILLPINLTDYETFTEEEKSTLNEVIKQFKYLKDNYFEIKETQKIMEEFSIGTKTSEQEFQEEKQEEQIYFAEDSKNNQTIINSLNNILNSTNTKTAQNFIKKESIFETLMIILDQKVEEEELINLDTYENKILIELGPRSNNLIPAEINLYLSEEKYSDSINLPFPNREDAQTITPILSSKINEATKYVKAEIKNIDKNQKDLLISIDLNKDTYPNFKESKIDSIELTLSYSFEKRTNHKINIIYGKCEEVLGSKLRTMGWRIDSNKILEKCDNNLLLKDLNALDKNNSRIIQSDTNTTKDSNNFDEELIKTLIEEFFENNSILSNLPLYTITKDKNISLRECENGCFIQTKSNSIKNLFDQNITKDNNTIKVPYNQIKNITIVLVDSNEEKPTDLNLSYKCNSPCSWTVDNNIDSNMFGNVSIAVIKQTTLTNIKIQGDYNKEFVKDFEFIDYTSETNFQLPNNEAMEYIKELKKQKKIILALYPFESTQKIKVFIPQELREIETIMKTRKAPFLLKDGTVDPNTKGWCSAYATRFAKKYFGLNYARADAWELAKANKIAYREQFNQLTGKGGMTKQQFVGFAENERIIAPGDIIGVYTQSRSNRPYRLYTHVMVYLGKMNGEHMFVENYLGPRVVSIDEVLKKHTIIDIIKPKN